MPGSNFLFVTTDAETVDGAAAPAVSIVNFRLQAGAWPLYANTPHQKNLKKGDRILLYCGGRFPDRGRILAAAEVRSLESVRNPMGVEETRRFLTGMPSTMVFIDKIQRFEAPVAIRDVLTQLECCPKNLAKWGVILHAGVRQLSDRDFKTIVLASRKPSQGAKHARVHADPI